MKIHALHADTRSSRIAHLSLHLLVAYGFARHVLGIAGDGLQEGSSVGGVLS
jgi:hypothetical protein